MSQPEIWVSISIRGAHDGDGQPHEKVLDLKISGAAIGDTQVMPAVPPATLDAPARSQLPVVNIVIGGEPDEAASRHDGSNSAAHMGNGGCAGSFGGGRAARSVGSARAVPSLFGGKNGNRTVFGGESVDADDQTASIGIAQVGDGGTGGEGAGGANGDDNNGYGAVPSTGWTGASGRGGQSGAVSAIGYQSIAFAGFVGANQSSNGAAGTDDAPDGSAAEAEVTSDDASKDAVSEGGLGGHWGNGLAVGGRDGFATAGGPMRTANGANGGSYGAVRPSTNGHSGSEG